MYPDRGRRSRGRRLFGTHGIRGLVDDVINPHLALDLGYSFDVMLGPSKKVLVAHDPRTSSQALEDALVSGLLDSGCNIKRLGMTATPILSFTMRNLTVDAGVMITASHNPPQYNGIKFYASDGSSLSREDEKVLQDIYFDRRFSVVDYRQKGREEEVRGSEERYIESIKSRFDRDVIEKTNIKVVVDCGDGATSYLTPRILKEIGCKVQAINCTPDGLFVHRPLEPVAENLGQLIELVTNAGASLGVAHDGDGDRSAYIEEKGNFIQGDRIFALLCHHILKDHPRGAIVTPVNTSNVIIDAAEMVKAKVYWTPVGEPEFVATMKKTNAEIGGEENVGVVFRDWSWGREGPFSVANVIEVMAEMKKPLSEILSIFPRYESVKTLVRLTDDKYNRLRESGVGIIENKIPRGYDRLLTMDGLKAYYGDDWLLIRPSGTEPLIRIFAESRDAKRCRELANAGVEAVKEAVASHS